MTDPIDKSHAAVTAAAEAALEAAVETNKKALEARRDALDSMISSYRSYIYACEAEQGVALATDNPVDERQAKRDKAHLAGIAADCVLHAHDLPDTTEWLKKIREVTQLRKDLLGY